MAVARCPTFPALGYPEVSAIDEYRIRELLGQVKAGRVSRRSFVQTMVGSGLSAPMAAQLLARIGVAQGQPKSAGFTPTRRGGRGRLRLLWWRGPTLLNPHLSVGVTNSDGSRIFYEPLAAFNSDGNLVPVLADEIPSDRNGGVGRDGRSVVWKLKKGVTFPVCCASATSGARRPPLRSVMNRRRSRGWRVHGTSSADSMAEPW